jgi:RND superfamily putative drug exporter
MGSAGRSVVFAGLTVVVSLLGLVLVGIGWIGGMAVGVSVTVLATMLASVTLLPALLGFAGERVEVTRWRGLIAAGGGAVALLGLGLGIDGVAAAGALVMVVTLLAAIVVAPLRRPVPRRASVVAVAPGRSGPSGGGGWAHRWSRTVQRHPARWIGAATLVLAVLAAPVAALRLGWADEGNFPEGTPTRQAYDLLADGFGPGFNGPFLITAVPSGGPGGSGPGSDAAVAALRDALAATPGVAAVTPPVADDPVAPGAYLMTLVPTTAPQDEATSDLVNRLRDGVVPGVVAASGSDLDVRITGSAAVDIDSTDYLARRMPIFFAAVLAVSFVLLMVVFRSLLVPLKAVVMNVASIAAAYGVVVAVFQWGWGSGLVGVEGGPINPFVPMMLFAIVFGLSMDYEVFLLSRIREEYGRTGDARASVADGLASTARVITAAAAIMVVVFASFLLEDNRDLKLFGLGLAVAVLLDATLIRMLLVPATMELLGDRNWWIPAWLDRLLPHLPSTHGPGPAPTGNEAAVAVEVGPVSGTGTGRR